MKLHDLRPAPGAHTPARRVGRGHGSGKGKTAGRGTKGQKARAGGGIPAWFEGGQTPLHVRTPKLHGFRNRGRVEFAPVNLGRLAEAEAGTLITPEVLLHDGILRRSKTKTLPVKILGNGDAPTGVTIHAHAFSRAALTKLAAAGSTAQRISWPDGLPIEMEDPPSVEKAARKGTSRSRTSAEPATDGADSATAAEDAEAVEAGEAREADAPEAANAAEEAGAEDANA